MCVTIWHFPSEELEYWPVHSVRKPKMDDSSIITPAVYDNFPPSLYI